MIAVAFGGATVAYWSGSVRDACHMRFPAGIAAEQANCALEIARKILAGEPTTSLSQVNARWLSL
jgi:hypothetical protein